MYATRYDMLYLLICPIAIASEFLTRLVRKNYYCAFTGLLSSVR